MRLHLAIALCWLVLQGTLLAGPATVRETTLEIPTYALGPADKNPPLWNEKVYPYPMQTAVSSQRTTKSYRAVILENDYIQVIVLPELGGKIYAAHDKTNGNCDFIYRNHVIKPGLVALRGAWTSGGIEWNFPTRGHTVNTFSPVLHTTRRNSDGSVTCTVGTTEWVRRLEWAVSITVYPGPSCFQNRILLSNPTLAHQRAYFWANAAVHAYSDTRVTFPPADFTFAGLRRTPEPWPVNQGRDVSWYKNTPFPHDFFCGTPGDFQGAYHAQRDAGTVHCAAWHESYGRKFWTWGTAGNGRIWDKFLTDDDGPYIEVQSGRLQTQGDTWLFEPHMRETFAEYWYPVKQLGGLIKASPAAALGVSRRGDGLRVALNTTREFDKATVEIVAGGKTVSLKDVTFTAAGVWSHQIDGLKPDAKLERVRVRCQDRTLLDYDASVKPLPPPELEPEVPAQIDNASAEAIYFKGYYAMKHWNVREAVGLFEESLKRDPGFTPALRMLGILCYQTGRYQEARDYCDKALSRNDDDDTCRYYRALAKIALGQDAHTEMDLYTVGRRAAHRHVAPYALAALAVGNGDLDGAERLLSQAGAENPQDMKVKVALLAVGRHKKERQLDALAIERVLQDHPLNRMALVERVFQGGKDDLHILGDDPQQYLETACDYLELNFRADVAAVLELYRRRPAAPRHPMIEFYAGYLADLSGKPDRAADYYRQGVALPLDYVFPFRNEDLAVLRAGLRHLPDHWKLHALLGTALVAKQQTAAGREHLAAAARSAQADATVHRNLGEVLRQDPLSLAQAAEAFRRAVALDPHDCGHYVALDNIYSALHQPAQRASLFAAAPPDVRGNHQVLLREATYLVDVGQFEQALKILRNNRFHVWEGRAEGQELFIRALHARADQAMKAGQYQKAIADLEQAMEYPENLGAGMPHAPNYVREYYKLGVCHQALGHAEQAAACFQKAVACPVDLLREDPESRRKAAEQLKARRPQ